MAERPKELPDLSVRLDQAILDPLLTNEQLLDLCDAARLEGVRAICCTPDRLPQLRERLGGSGEAAAGNGRVGRVKKAGSRNLGPFSSSGTSY